MTSCGSAAVTFRKILIATLALGSVAASQPFQVASLKPNTSGNPNAGNVLIQPGGRISATNVTIRQLIEFAYRRHGFDRREISGGPAWVDSDRFDLAASAAGEHVLDRDGSPRQTWLMLRNFLAHRLKLTVHTESRQMPIHALVLARPDGPPGPRLRKVDVDCGTVLQMSLKGQRSMGANNRPLCGQAEYPRRLVASAVTMPDLASILSRLLKRVVVDRTGLAGNYDLEVEAVEIEAPGPFGPSYRPSDTTQSIFAALPEQLGLALEATTAPVEIVVIDHVEKPAAESVSWEDPTKHRVQFVKVEDGARLEVLDWGGTGRPVVLLAGSGNTAHVFDEFAPELTDCCHVYGITRRGFGASSRPDRGYDDQGLADDVLQVLDTLRIEKPVLVGHSMAGGELTTLGNQHSNRLGGLVYLDALGDPRDWPASDPAWMAALNRLPVGVQKRPAPRSEEESRSFSGYRAWQLRSEAFAFPESELRNMFATNPDGTMGRFNTPGYVHDAIGEGQKKRDYSHIRVPVLAIYEFPRSVDDTLKARGYQPKDAEERAAIEAFANATAAFFDRWKKNLQSGVPGARFIDVPDAGHYVFLTRKAEVLRGVHELVAGLH
jgi:non-heme chloroperoxidase